MYKVTYVVKMLVVIVDIVNLLEIILVVIKGLVIESLAGEVVHCTGYDLGMNAMCLLDI